MSQGVQSLPGQHSEILSQTIKHKKVERNVGKGQYSNEEKNMQISALGSSLAKQSYGNGFCGCAWFFFSLLLEAGTMCPLAKQKLKMEINEHKMGPTEFPITSLEEARGSRPVTTSALKGPL